MSTRTSVGSFTCSTEACKLPEHVLDNGTGRGSSSSPALLVGFPPPSPRAPATARLLLAPAQKLLQSKASHCAPRLPFWLQLPFCPFVLQLLRSQSQHAAPASSSPPSSSSSSGCSLIVLHAAISTSTSMYPGPDPWLPSVTEIASTGVPPTTIWHPSSVNAPADAPKIRTVTTPPVAGINGGETRAGGA
eukprot:791772-Rhodomonas_salina.7